MKKSIHMERGNHTLLQRLCRPRSCLPIHTECHSLPGLNRPKQTPERPPLRLSPSRPARSVDPSASQQPSAPPPAMNTRLSVTQSWNAIHRRQWRRARGSRWVTVLIKQISGKSRSSPHTTPGACRSRRCRRGKRDERWKNTQRTSGEI